MAKKKTYNLNEMRECLLKAHNAGNGAIISKKVCEENGVSEVFFKDYLSRVEKLHAAICQYVRAKHASTAQITKEFKGEASWNKTVVALREAIFPLWKNLLECGEKDKTKKSLHVNPADVDSLVGYAEMFMDSGNNKLDAEEELTFPKVIACVTLNKFRKQVETLLGIRIAEENVLSDARRDFLIAERRLISRIKRTRATIDAIKDEIASLEHFKSLIKNKEEVARIEALIAEKTTIISGNREGGKDNLEKQLNDTMEKLTKLYSQESTLCAEPKIKEKAKVAA